MTERTVGPLFDPKLYFLDAPKEQPGTCFVKHEDYVALVRGYRVLQNQLHSERAAHEPCERQRRVDREPVPQEGFVLVWHKDSESLVPIAWDAKAYHHPQFGALKLYGPGVYWTSLTPPKECDCGYGACTKCYPAPPPPADCDKIEVNACPACHGTLVLHGGFPCDNCSPALTK